MKNNLHFDFIVNKENNTIAVKREFAAARQLVWDCYTKSELLNQWFAPQPFTTKTKFMDFKAGGYWLYAMIEPSGKEHWGRMDYLDIYPIDSYSALDGFCNADGELNTKLSRSTWNAVFTAIESKTLVQTIISYNSLADLETVVQMGLEQGLTSTLERLDNLLETLAK